MQAKVNKEDLISDVIENYPETLEVFLEYGLGCVGCHGASFETIEEGAMAHGFTDEQIDQLVSDINDVFEVRSLNKKEKKKTNS